MNRTLIALLAAAGFASAQAAKIDINGDVTQDLKADKAIVSSVAVGIASRARTTINTVEGNVRIRGSLKQTAAIDKAAISSVAVGAGAKADTRLNTLSSE